MEHEADIHITGYGTLVTVWALLLVLTGLLVGASSISASLAVWAMLFLTPLKAGLVFYFFMHLRYEGPVLKTMLLVAIIALIVFIGMTFLDVASR